MEMAIKALGLRLVLNVIGLMELVVNGVIEVG